MNRDMDLVRDILLQVEAHDRPRGSDVTLNLPQYSEDLVSYHVKLLAEAGLIKAVDDSTMLNFRWRPTALTWEGHEFLDNIKNDEVWSKTKEKIKEKGGWLGLEVVKALAVSIAKKLVGLG